MSDASIAPDTASPRKRAFAPEPTIDRTHLYESRGPLVWVCLHATRGALIATSGRTTHWSHHGTAPSALTTHPDAMRIAFVWATEKEARGTMIAISTYAEFESLSFHEIRCDVAQSRYRTDFVHIDETPSMHVSIEACQRGPMTHLPMLAAHRLDPKMRRAETRMPTISAQRTDPERRAEG